MTIALPLIVSAWFQILFHSPNRGSFHLSLTVLVRYRSSRVFSLGEWSPLLPTGLACPVVLRITAGSVWLSSTGLSPCTARLSSPLRLAFHFHFCGSYNPDQQADRFGLFPFRSPLLGKSFLFLRVLRCFSSPRSLLTAMCSPPGTRALPHVGFPIRISSVTSVCTRLTGAFRSVPRPSSALDAKASTIRS